MYNLHSKEELHVAWYTGSMEEVYVRITVAIITIDKFNIVSA